MVEGTAARKMSRAWNSAAVRLLIAFGMTRKAIARGATGLVLAGLIGLAGCAVPGEAPAPNAAPNEAVTSEPLAPPRAKGKSQQGLATYYSGTFNNHRMADGSRFNPRSDSAASLTLPLGSRAEVKNLENGRTAMVTIRDRGPHAPGAIIDVSPKIAEELGMIHQGKVRVRVTPVIAVAPAAAEQREAKQ